jgi:hypothetical protein
VALYGNALGSDKVLISYPNFLDWQREAQLFSSMAALAVRTVLRLAPFANIMFAVVAPLNNRLSSTYGRAS